MESITPDKVRGLRDLLNSSAMDIMYYNSPLYRDEVRAPFRLRGQNRSASPSSSSTHPLPPSHADHQGPNAGAEQAVLALLLAQPGVRGQRGQGVHRVPLVGLRHHLRHHDGLGPGAVLPAGAPRHGGEAGPALDVLRGETHSGAAAAHAHQVPGILKNRLRI